ncbi:MAG: rRNA cytosine-C5-methyltransferase [Bacteroidales bacterium]|nr:rRNA cytosine-C5-methyltransferase [Bacteroidales bacterium]
MRDFDVLLRESLPDYAADALLEVLGDGSSSAEVSIRLNPQKASDSDFDMRPVPWCKDAFFLSERPNFTLDPSFHAGAYYVQDSSCMFPALIADKILDSLSPKGAVLDLCASPGGKSTHLISILKDKRPLVVCNEAVGKRVPPLTDNIAKWGEDNVIVTNASAGNLGKASGFFDVMLADVPCSGEGMFRKSADAIEGWSLSSVRDCVALQRTIISDVWPALREGGLLIYSTCTYNHFENQDNVKYIAEKLGAEYVPVEDEILPSGVVKLPWGYQFVPGLVPGEGQFFAVLRKTSSASGRRKPIRKARFVSAGDALVLDKVNNQIYAFDLSLDFANWISEVNPSCVKTLGCRVGEIKAGKIIPDADLALSTALIGAENGHISVNSTLGKVSALEFSCAEINRETALKFLSRENITPQPSWPRGYILLRYQSLGIGFVNNLGNRCNNLHPLMRRILKVR